MTHPFHPWSGREFVFVAVRQTWAGDRVFFLDGEGRQHSLPVGWTDAAGPDVFVTVAAGRCPFKVADLLALARLAEGCRPGRVPAVAGRAVRCPSRRVPRPGLRPGIAHFGLRDQAEGAAGDAGVRTTTGITRLPARCWYTS